MVKLSEQLLEEIVNQALIKKLRIIYFAIFLTTVFALAVAISIIPTAGDPGDARFPVSTTRANLIITVLFLIISNFYFRFILSKKAINIILEKQAKEAASVLRGKISTAYILKAGILQFPAIFGIIVIARGLSQGHVHDPNLWMNIVGFLMLFTNNIVLLPSRAGLKNKLTTLLLS